MKRIIGLVMLLGLLGACSQEANVPQNGDAPATALRTAATTYGIQNLGTLGGMDSEAVAASSNGSVVVGNAYDTTGQTRAFRWENGVLQDLGSLDDSRSDVQAVSSDGSVVVGSGSVAAQQGGYWSRIFLWKDGKIQDLGTLGGGHSEFRDMNGDGSVIVGRSHTSSNQIHTFLWKNGTMQDLGDLGGEYPKALVVSSDGSVLVGSAETPSGHTQAFRWKNGVTEFLGSLGSGHSEAVAVSGDGSVVVGSSTNTLGETRAFRWKNGTMQDLGTLEGSTTLAHAVSYDGSVVVGESSVSAGEPFSFYSHAFRWKNGIMQDLGTFGGNSNAVALNRDGSVIVGWSDDGRSESRAVRWENGTMQVLDTLDGGNQAGAVAVSDDGLVVIGNSSTSFGFGRAVRWTAQASTPVDDGDGIASEIDGRYSSGVFSDESGVFSDHFTDQHLEHSGVRGKTFGNFITRGGLTITITDSLGNGVEANVIGGGTGTATIQACSDSKDYTVNMTTPTRALIQCGSLTLEVLEGKASVTLGNGAVVSVPEGASAKMDKLDGSYSVENLSTTSDAPITLTVGDTVTKLSPRETKAASYDFTGFFQPIDMDGVFNVAKAGSVIPVKFSLGGDQGLNIFAAGYPKAPSVPCLTSSVLDNIEQVSTTSGLKYDAVTGQYNYAWKTGSWAGTCRRLEVKLVDGKTYTANFKFTK